MQAPALKGTVLAFRDAKRHIAPALSIVSSIERLLQRSGYVF